MRERRTIDLGVMAHAILRASIYIPRQQSVGEVIANYERNFIKRKKEKKKEDTK
jgi:hypothetical protein